MRMPIGEALFHNGLLIVISAAVLLLLFILFILLLRSRLNKRLEQEYGKRRR